MSAGRAFFDTNVLLYMYGGPDLAKQVRAKELFRQHTRDGSIVLSTQVVQEFYAAGSKKLRIPRRELQKTLDALLDLPLVTIAASQIQSAIGIEERYDISFWDALIVAAAIAAGADMLYTEDLNHQQHYGPVTAHNPFT